MSVIAALTLGTFIACVFVFCAPVAAPRREANCQREMRRGMKREACTKPSWSLPKQLLLLLAPF